MTYDVRDVAYAAGIIDGEGCIQIQERRNKQERSLNPSHLVIVTVNMTDQRVPRWLEATFGGRCSFIERQKRPTHRPIYRWQLQGRRATPFLRTVLPYLRVKSEQAELALRLYDEAGYRRGQGPVPQDEVARRRTLKTEMHRLNARGVADVV